MLVLARIANDQDRFAISGRRRSEGHIHHAWLTRVQARRASVGDLEITRIRTAGRNRQVDCDGVAIRNRHSLRGAKAMKWLLTEVELGRFYRHGRDFHSPD